MGGSSGSASGLVGAAGVLRGEMARIDPDGFPGFVYNPLDYAWDAHAEYLGRGAMPGKEVVFVGMNPGPWGMMQTGVPFGEVGLVRDWMGIRSQIRRPECEHPKRPIQGWGCERSEVSGRRLWGYFRDRFGTVDAFFKVGMVLNYCPLAFLGESGRNLTPDKFPAEQTAKLFAACDAHLEAALGALEPEWVLGVGRFALTRIEAVFGKDPKGFRVGTILHPSPASPVANRGWAAAAGRQLETLGIWKMYP